MVGRVAGGRIVSGVRVGTNVVHCLHHVRTALRDQALHCVLFFALRVFTYIKKELPRFAARAFSSKNEAVPFWNAPRAKKVCIWKTPGDACASRSP